MSKYTHDVIILGGGAAGLTTASGCAQLGLKTALIDRARLGGDCLYYGCVPSKTLLKCAHVRQDSKEAESYGLPPMDVPPADMAKVNARVAEVIASIAHHDSPERFRELGAEVFFGHPRFLNPHEVRIDGDQTLSAKRIVIATGSSPRALPIPGLEEAQYITNKDVFSLKTLPKKLLVIGAGPIGVEISQAFVRLGSEVTILSNSPHILAREDPDVAAIVETKLINEGITVIGSVKITKVDTVGGGKRIHFEKDGKTEIIEGTEILVSAGRVGNHDTLDIHRAGIDEERSFIKVDSSLRTSAHNIMAIGDANGKYLFTHVAGAEGSLAIRRNVFRLPAKMDYTLVPWCTYTDPEIASVGYNELRARDEGIDYKLIETPMKDVDRANAERATDGKIKVLLDRKDRVIGTQIIGPAAGELLGPSILAVKNRYKMMELTSPMFPYPTLGEIHKKTGGNFYAPKLFNPRVKGLLKAVFRYRGN